MPALDILQQFKSNVRSIGNEAAVLAEQGVPLNDLPLVDSQQSTQTNTNETDTMDSPTLPGFGDESTLASQMATGLDDIDLPDLPDFGDESTLVSQMAAGLDDIDLPDLPDFGDEGAAPSQTAAGSDDIDLSDLPSFGDEDTSPSQTAAGLDDIDFSDLPSFGDESTLPSQTAAGLDSLSDLSNLPDFDTDKASSPLDTFDIDTATLSNEFIVNEPAPPVDFNFDDSSEEFTLPNADEFLGNILNETKASDDVEEIELSEDDFQKMQETLSRYPLNVRIACEELIAEQVLAPETFSKLVKMLIRGVSAREAADFAGKLLKRSIIVPKGFEKKSIEELEAERSAFKYIFIHRILPVLRIALFIGVLALSAFYLIYRFIYTPIHADSIYRKGYEQLLSGYYEQANERFQEAGSIHRVKKWYYRYAEAFKNERHYLLAEEKYDELLLYYPRDKKGILQYADMETRYLQNYQKADSLLSRNILDYSVNDKEGLLAVGDNNLLWGDIDPERYENAREAFARYIERYGRTDPVLERMMKYFIRTDNLKEVLLLQAHFMDDKAKRKISADSLSDLGGYLLDKKLEETKGVPNEYISAIDGLRDIFLTVNAMNPSLPEPYYHLARYYNYFDNTDSERTTLEDALAAFQKVPEESVRRIKYHIDTKHRYAQLLIQRREFFTAEEQLVQGIDLYESTVKRTLIPRSAQFGKLYADLGDIEYFTKEGDMETAIRFYTQAEQNGWSSPEMQYRIGASHYYLEQWGPALERLFKASTEMPFNRRILHALGNAAYMRGNYFAAQGYNNELLALLRKDRARFPVLMPQERSDQLELVERLMVAQNNMGVVMEALADRSGDDEYRSHAQGLYVESARAWDALTRDPETLLRSGIRDISSPSINLASLNSRNMLYPETTYKPQLYMQIDKDVQEPSDWERLMAAQ
ncbi:MAG: tetratricopeptide repeat protein [Spirochaetaceae bacterium]|jgi:tetratricopeptide (TPR) repeat protein|nr:tetratricopeptide repeat protein [Spirochaetaceae bacterium]